MNNDIIKNSEHPLAFHDKAIVTKNSLVLSDDITDSGIAEIVNGLNQVESSRLWIWGDLLREIERLRPARARSDSGQFDKAQKNERVEFILKESGYSEKTLRNAKWICTMFPAPGRRSGIHATFTHHEVAYTETKQDVAEALFWIDRSISGKWSTSYLRQQIRISRSTEREDEEYQYKPGISKLVAAARLAISFDVGNIPRKNRAQIKEDIKPIVELYEKL